MTRRSPHRPRALHALLALTLTLALGVAGHARAEPPSCTTSGNEKPFSLALSALNGPQGTDVYATVATSVAACPVPNVLKKLQVKALTADASTDAVHNYADVAAPGGAAKVTPPGLPRGQRLEVTALVQSAEEVRTHVVTQTATVRLRPDLVVERVTAPKRVVRKQPFAVEVALAEAAGDTGGAATMTLRDGTTVLGTTSFTLAAGAKTTLSFPLLRLPAVGAHELVATVSEAAPAQLDERNDSGRAALAVAMYDADGIVSTENAQATKVGLDVLRAGGNAIDAAAAVQFALNVVEPENSGIGGGATILVHLANGGGDWAIDAREPSTAATTARTFARPSVDRSGLAVGVPMTLRAVDEMLRRWGTTSLAQSLGPATALAENGMKVSEQLARSAAGPRGGFFPETAAVFRPGGRAVQPQDTLVQPDLAKTFRLIAAQGPSVFYNGEIARAVVAATRKTVVAGNEGNMTLADLAKGGSDDLAADGRITPAISVDYRGRRFVGVPGSSAGGLVTLQWLELIERFPIGTGGPGWGFQEPKSTHVMIEAFRLAFSDRFMWMGDPRRAQVPIAGLLSDGYIAARSALIRDDTRIPTPPLIRLPGNPLPFQTAPESHAVDTGEGQQTSHFSIVDRWGNAVSFTATLADAFGSGIMVPGYGFVLNDSMTNFWPNPEANPATGNPGTNDAAPDKIPMGSTAPLIALEDGEPVLVTGSPGGAFIMAVVFQVASNVFDYGKTIEQAVAAPRIWANLSMVMWNAEYPPETIAALRALGHPLRPLGPSPSQQVGSAESIRIDPETFTLMGAVDPRTAPDAQFALLAPS